MSEYKYRPQPLDLAYAPPRLPGHDYTGPGWIATIRIGTGPGDVVGHLTATESFDAIGFDSLAMFTHEGTAPADTDAGFVRKAVQAVLRRAAREGRTGREAWDAVLDGFWCDPPVLAPMDGLQGGQPGA